MIDQYKRFAAHNYTHYVLILLTIYSVDVLINLFTAPIIKKDLYILGYFLYFIIIMPPTAIILYLTNMVRQFAPTDNSSLFSLWSLVFAVMQFFPAFMYHLPRRFVSMSLILTFIFSISYGIFWSIYSRGSNEESRKPLFLWSQILLLIGIQLTLYININYVRYLLTLKGLLANVIFFAALILLLLIGRLVFVNKGLDFSSDEEAGNKYLEDPDEKPHTAIKNTSMGKKILFSNALAIFNIIILIALLLQPAIGFSNLNEYQGKKIMEEANAKKMSNVILIVMNSVRAKNLDLYGYERETMPGLTNWSSEATTYRNAFANSSASLASHASIFTGLYPSNHNCRYEYSKKLYQGNIPITEEDIFRTLKPEYKTLTESLSEKGYYTVGISSNFTELDLKYGIPQGFYLYRSDENAVPEVLPYRLLRPTSRFFTPLVKLYKPYRPAEEITDDAITWLQENDDNRFFMFLNFMDAHLPCDPILKYKEMFYDEDVVMEANYPKQTKQIMYYDAELRYLDDQIGRLVEYLKSKDYYDDSIIIITSDHGESVGEWGRYGDSFSLNNWEIKIPLLVKYIGQKEEKVVEYPVQLADIFPTVTASLDIDVSINFDGVNLKEKNNRLVAAELNPYFPVIQEYGSHFSRSQTAFVIDSLKIILSTNKPPGVFDIKNDPEERKNLMALYKDLIRRTKEKFKQKTGKKLP